RVSPNRPRDVAGAHDGCLRLGNLLALKIDLGGAIRRVSRRVLPRRLRGLAEAPHHRPHPVRTHRCEHFLILLGPAVLALPCLSVRPRLGRIQGAEENIFFAGDLNGTRSRAVLDGMEAQNGGRVTADEMGELRATCEAALYRAKRSSARLRAAAKVREESAAS